MNELYMLMRYVEDHSDEDACRFALVDRLREQLEWSHADAMFLVDALCDHEQCERDMIAVRSLVLGSQFTEPDCLKSALLMWTSPAICPVWVQIHTGPYWPTWRHVPLLWPHQEQTVDVVRVGASWLMNQKWSALSGQDRKLPPIHGVIFARDLDAITVTIS